MKFLGFSLLAFGLVLAVLPASAQGETSFTFVGHTDGASNYWTVDGHSGNNPTIAVPASTEVTVTVSSATGYHQFRVGDNNPSDPIDAGADAITYTFTSPASGTVQYICPFHTGDMHGLFSVGGATTTTTPATHEEEKKGAPGVQVVGVAVAMLGAALLLRRK